MFAKQALSIGINAYVPSRLVLRPCLNDANDVSTALRLIGFRVQPALDTSLDSMKSNIRHFTNSIQPGAIVVFYFSGHGVQSNGNNYLIPTNATGISADNIKSTAIDVQKVIEQMYEKEPRVVICILDCCRTDPPKDPLDGFNRYDLALAGTRPGFAPMRPPPSTILAYACAANDAASARSKNGRNSLYTYRLLQYIRTPNVDIETILKQVAADVQRDSDNEQIPYRYSSCNETIYLASNKGLKAPVVRQDFGLIPVLQPPIFKQHGNAVSGHQHHRQHHHHPDPNYNNFQQVLNGHFGLPVYQYLAVKNKSPHIQKSPYGVGHPSPKSPYYYRR